MPTAKGVSAPFFFALHVPSRRDSALMTRATEDFRAGHFADALVTAESLCRAHPTAIAPAVLRARILQECRPTMAPRAWSAAWSRDPLDPTLQDVMLQSWLRAGSARRAAEQGMAFLPQRCRAGSHESLVKLLQQAGVERAGACWRDGAAIEVRCFGTAQTETRIVLATEDERRVHEVPTSGELRIEPPRAGGVWSVAFEGGGLLQGSPLVFDSPAPLARAGRIEGGVDIVIPVYRDTRGVQVCLRSVLESLPTNRTRARVIVVNDASPEVPLVMWLETLAANGRITLLHNTYNLGFIETINRGLKAGRRDAVMLNADTFVHGNWIDRLRTALYASEDIASVMPWSNNGEIGSLVAGGVDECSTKDAIRIDQAASACAVPNLQVPTNSGFAMMMRREVLDSIGLLDGETLVRGYLEEVDWCLRAREAGWRHVLATQVFVAHRGSASFGIEKQLRVRQNRAVIASRYPDYYREYGAFLAGTLLADARRAVIRTLEGTWPPPMARAGDERVEADAALPSACRRVGVWRLRAGSDAFASVLREARRMSSDLRGPRLIVFGDTNPALEHTGIVDAIPPAPPGEDIISDATLASLAGCTEMLATGNAELPPGVQSHPMELAA
jgi:GT2 family glycosyltransferase